MLVKGDNVTKGGDSWGRSIYRGEIPLIRVRG